MMFINGNLATGLNDALAPEQSFEIDAIRGELCVLLNRLQDACENLIHIGDRMFGPVPEASVAAGHLVKSPGGSIHDLREVVGGYDRVIDRVRSAISRLENL